MGFNLTLPSRLFVVLINPRPLLSQTHLITQFPHGQVSALMNTLDHGRPEISPDEASTLVFALITIKFIVLTIDNERETVTI